MGSVGPVQQDPVGHAMDWFCVPQGSGKPLTGFKQMGDSLIFVF